MQLVVTEKPSVARDFAEALPGTYNRDDAALVGNKRIITWCIGHVGRLASPAEYHPAWENWSFDHLPMIPDEFQLKPSKHTLDHWKHLANWLVDSRIDEIVNGCDAGREGELIFRRAYLMAGASAPVHRLWLSSMTPSAIRRAFDDLQPSAEYESLYDAARSRAQADWLIGLNATRAMTLAAQQRGHRGVKSLGRVQTPTLTLLVRREREIRDFEPTPFYQIYATLEQSDSTFEAQLQTEREKNRIFEQGRAEEIEEQLPELPAEITAVDEKKKSKDSPLPYDLSALQQDANKRHGYTAQQTLDAAQTLYEAGAITYPRTDSGFLTPDMRPNIHDRLQAIDADPWADPNLDGDDPPIPRELIETAQSILDTPANHAPPDAIFDADKVTDHHAILPTGKSIHEIDADERAHRVYALVLRRFIAQFLGPAQYLVTTIDLEIGDFPFRAKGKQRTDAGWRAISVSDDTDALLPSIETGPAAVVDTRLHEGETRPPRRYTESRLLKAMERAGHDLDERELRRAIDEVGLGTPATRANIIEKLLDRDYAARNGNHIVPTADGEALIDSLPEQGLKSPRLTARWEKALRLIADGELDRDAFLEKVRQLTTAIVDGIRDADLQFEGPDSAGDCPLCSTPVTERDSVYTCQSGRDCSFVIGKEISGRRLSASELGSLLEGETVGPLDGFNSKQGAKFSASLYLDDNAKLQFEFD